MPIKEMEEKMKKVLFAFIVSAATVASAQVPFKLGIAGYTFCRQSLTNALATMKKIDCHYLCHKDFMLPYNASAEAIAEFKAKVANAGVECVATGPLYATDEAVVREQFEFAKRYGMKVVVGVPYDWDARIKNITDNKERAKLVEPRKWRVESDRVLDFIEKMVKEYDICYAIHNHGPDMSTLYPTASAAIKRIGNRDKRIGVCLDIGHEARNGDDPVKFIRENSERIYDIHIKNIKIDRDRNIAMEAPRGELNIPAVFKALADVGYTGVCHIEYEKDFADNAMGLAESVGYFRGVMDATKAKDVLRPVPEGANQLSAAEKADGWELLFDGKTLPKDVWVGVKEKFKAFPSKGWYVKDGAIAMYPMFTISDEGQWSELPPEDKKLGGGGDIVTKKKYRNFIFKFDFRLTSKANSGVKYFYDEKFNTGTCEEYQVLDTHHPDYTKGRDGNRKVAALYDLMPAPIAEKVVKPVGAWNSGMIVAKGAHVEHWLNGVKVLEYERGGEAFRNAVAASKYATWGKDADGKAQPWGELAEGRILLQDHTDSSVSYCNLKVKEIK